MTMVADVYGLYGTRRRHPKCACKAVEVDDCGNRIRYLPCQGRFRYSGRMATPALPPCAQPGISGGGVTTTPLALPCGLSIPIPKITLPTITLPFQFPPVFPFPPKIGFQLSCDLKNPISVTATLPKGAIRIPCFDVDGDAAEAA